MVNQQAVAPHVRGRPTVLGNAGVLMNSRKSYWRALALAGAGVLAAVLQPGCATADHGSDGDTAMVRSTQEPYGSHWGELRNSDGEPVGIYGPPRS